MSISFICVAAAVSHVASSPTPAFASVMPSSISFMMSVENGVPACVTISGALVRSTLVDVSFAFVNRLRLLPILGIHTCGVYAMIFSLVIFYASVSFHVSRYFVVAVLTMLHDACDMSVPLPAVSVPLQNTPSSVIVPLLSAGRSISLHVNMFVPAILLAGALRNSSVPIAVSACDGDAVPVPVAMCVMLTDCAEAFRKLKIIV